MKPEIIGLLFQAVLPDQNFKKNVWLDQLFVFYKILYLATIFKK